ncbi:hypothetical protein Poli38472_011848 [Pythium oligandrum]|uniref:Uncharacterized protein n=1 Tax=Pythium oligandrum TaxID=41045 RepID=A0A8K1FCF4_PYTOL|nr:hypothetical protein Poli38472_011848 [Pythium oligandrum]|eukprot:TMW58260.1 hypothetical protein Poli38472_011848 [Pythium oligandrum]
MEHDDAVLATQAEELAAALALVDESDFACFDAVIDSSLSSAYSEPSSTDPETDTGSSSKSSLENDTPTFVTGTRKRRYNAKEELQYLRGTIKQLEGRLAVLKDQSSSGSSTRRQAPTKPAVTTLDKMWARIADRQFQHREKSELENARLRGLVEDQLRLIRGLERMLTKKRTKVMSWYTDGKHQSVTGAVVDPLEDPIMEKQMEQGVEDMLADVGGIVADPRYVTETDEPFHMTGFLSEDSDNPTVETLDARLFPFPYQTAADELWGIWTNKDKPKMHNIHRLDVEATNDRIRRVIEGEYNFRAYKVPFRAKLIGRRIVQPDRVIILTIVLVDPMQMNEGKHTGVFLQERTWNILRTVPADENLPSGATISCRQSYSLTTPLLFTSSDDNGVGQLTNSLIQTTSMRMNLTNEVLEDRLLASFDKLHLNDSD